MAVYKQTIIIVFAHSKVKCNAATEGERDKKKEIIMVSASKHSLLPLHRNIQFAATEDVTQGAQLYQRNTGAIVMQS